MLRLFYFCLIFKYNKFTGINKENGKQKLS